jgi:hypothetical protein
VRGILAFALLAFLGAVIATMLSAAIFGPLTIDNAKEMAVFILTPLFGLVGTVTGFYYVTR